MIPIKQNFITRNHSDALLKAVGAVVHETATPGATDTNIRDAFQRSAREASSHAAVDWDSITQIVPWNETAWGAGATANKMFWQIELCHPGKHDPAKFAAVWKNAVDLFAYLFTHVANPKITRVTKDNLMSHREVSQKWHETTHVDPDSFFAEYGKTVDMFRADVQKAIDAILHPPAPTPPPPPPPKVRIYVVKKGDTLLKIAKMFNTTIAKIAADNHIVNPNLIIVGQKLIIK